MFTFLVQLWLLIVISGILVLVLQAAYLHFRDGRRNRRILAAHYYAQLVVMDRVAKGEFDGRSTEDIRQAYEFEKIAYLND